MAGIPRHIDTAGAWKETPDGLLYAVLAKSGEEQLAKAEVTLAVEPNDPESGVADLLTERTRKAIEEQIQEVARQQAVRVLDRRDMKSD